MSINGNITLSELPLHDAILRDLRVSWLDQTCVASVDAFVEGLSRAVQSRQIIWTKVVRVDVPIRLPWGPSNQINLVSEEGVGVHLIEMQSGDVIRVEAANVRFV